jgi:hypothetical protein
VSLLAQGKLQTQIVSPTYFMTRLDTIVLRILEKAGSGLPKEQEEVYLAAWRNLIASCSLQC